MIKQLQHLCIKSCKFSGPGLAALAQTVACLSQITHLGIGNVVVPIAQVKAASMHTHACESFMQALSVAPKLQELDLAVLRLPCSVQSLAHGFQCLQKLTVIFRLCKDPCLEFIPACTSVTQLSLHHEHIDDEAADDDDNKPADLEDESQFYLSFVARFPSVVSLYLGLPIDADCDRKMESRAAHAV